jgi:UDP:flavonoid glycosyltransferase YjiC (YdhE family)
LPDNVHIADYLPGEQAAQRSRLVICNGGSPTSQQALAAGVPVLGIAGNLDQYLNMAGVVRSGAGMLLRSDRLAEEALRSAALRCCTSRSRARRRAGWRSSSSATIPGRLAGLLARCRAKNGPGREPVR